MAEKHLFSLDLRLTSCADFVRNKAKLVDVGSDHAYIPIFLVKNNRIQKAIASDLRWGPLLNAKKNIERYGLSQQIETRLSPGLRNISEKEADDIIIAGLGGEAIIEIIDQAKWLKNCGKRLILQPMSADAKLRFFLKKEKYIIEKDVVTAFGNKVYVTMCVKYFGKDYETSELFPYIGFLDRNLSFQSKLYISRKIKSLEKQANGFKIQGNSDEFQKTVEIINKLNALIRG